MDNRKTYLDVVKVISVFFVIVVHISAINFSKVDVNTSTWMACNLYDSIAHFAAPVLFMVSGALFLNPDKDISIRKLYRKNILHVVIAFLFWSVAYSIVDNVVLTHSFNRESIHKLFIGIIEGHYHLWFCYAIIVCYIATPILRVVLSNKRNALYFCVISFFTVFVVNALKLIPTFQFAFNTIFTEAGLVTGGYICYYVIGHILDSYDSVLFENNRIGGGIITVGIISLLITIVGTAVVSRQLGRATEMLYDYLLPTTMMWSTLVLLLIKARCNISSSSRAGRLFRNLANYSFGAYLVHVFVYNVFLRIGLTPSLFSSYISIPVLAALTWIVSIGISSVLKRIPVLGKLIV